ncbi:23S rRNA (guanosine(2251)-2'-O)-methyltransferase RlmB [Acetobacterium carbinolicum]|jgi:23S rRNA (guanosine2251-2'-O)-methyltransferase|uniref:23S rRNA (guanosine(2251)-2'-O)-methyltransferase RlmB n=1 Tax=Acetobacterium TaxID=33951 RepID=UPI000DBEC11E|nr:23S rRNA (guanosine(2251)-2'-O)-methyltransferase RlmB [Acetobacterium sp. K1/6]AWW26737.1 23S rRNA (guanosine(2251)-2'-O)-methyltransferase RlmB [Acetobacterium sp. KB-1]MDK2942499.1 rRNA (guanosine2251-2-O)-methyltransferase [Acetobacterium sp.]MDZ5726753.1 23S rRNA (guanosine(2251)-2'-O)-methyltransferase RlmB [Acetobacterium sp. K1/6]
MKRVSNSRSNSTKTSDKPRGRKSDNAPKDDKKPRKFEERGARDDKKSRKFDARGPKEERGPRRFDERKPPRKQERFNREDDGVTEETFVIVGKNPVMEALRSGQEIDKLLILKDNTDHVLKKITDMAKKQNIIIHSVEKAKLEYLADGQVHQGIVALMAPFPYSDLQDILSHAKAKGRDPFIVILDHLTDPHNLGAIIRSANVCGADGVIIPNRRSASLTAVSVKASSGAVSHTPIVKVTNLSQTIDELKKKGFWIMSTDMKGNPYYKADYKGSLAIVIGNEGVGISEKVKKQCDFSVSIPIHGEIESFNASAAAAIIFSEAAKQRFQ